MNEIANDVNVTQFIFVELRIRLIYNIYGEHRAQPSSAHQAPGAQQFLLGWSFGKFR